MAKRGGFPGGNAGQHEQSDEAGSENAEADGREPESTGGERVHCDSERRSRRSNHFGKKEVTKVKISEDAVDPDDVEMLEDLIMAATNEALRKVEDEAAKAMGKLAGGLGSMGGGFPF